MRTHYCLTFEGLATPINLSCDKISILYKHKLKVKNMLYKYFTT